jgi:sporulation protein YlmC with PRC-barrel domain
LKEETMLKRHILLTTVGCAMFAAAAIAQSSPPSPSAPSAAPSTSASAPATQSAPPEQNLAGQGKWRASKLMGVDIYGADDKKVGDITEVLFDKAGKIEMVTVGVGGFLGIGSKDVAIPFDQVTWSDQPMVSAAPAPSAGGGAGSMSGTGASPTPPTAAAPKGPAMYPDHGKIAMTKEQLSSAPAVTYAAR